MRNHLDSYRNRLIWGHYSLGHFSNAPITESDPSSLYIPGQSPENVDPGVRGPPRTPLMTYEVISSRARASSDPDEIASDVLPGSPCGGVYDLGVMCISVESRR